MARGRPKKETESPSVDSENPNPDHECTMADTPAEAEPTVHPEPEDVIGSIEKILLKPKSKSAVPTFVTFRGKDELPLRHVIIDVPQSYLEEAWSLFKGANDNAQAEDFLALVNTTLKKGVPRLYRVVANLDLSE